MQHFSRRTRSVILISCAKLLSACTSDLAVTAGSGPTAGGNAATSAALSWQAPTQNTDGTPLTDISGYHVYLGTDPGSLAATTTLTDAGATSYTVTNLSPGTWYFAISAYNAEGIDGAFSNVGSKTIA